MLNKADFKIWKPWLENENIPKWAEDLKASDLKTVLTKDSKAGQKGIDENVLDWQKQAEYNKGNCELPIKFYQ